MTVRSFNNEEEFEMAIRETGNISDCFKTIVDEVSVEIIDKNEDSLIELSIPFTRFFCGELNNNLQKKE